MSAAEMAQAGGDHRDVWALVLALLAIPGSTIAWELPLGGLWLGVPLGVAAITIALRVRHRTAAKIAIALAGLALAQMAVYLLGSIAS